MPPLVSIGGIHLMNSSATPTPGGSPTSAATTPFAFGPGWTPRSAEPITIWSGGPPFRNGRTPLWTSYDTVTEKIPIAVVGTTHEEAVAALQQLKRAMQTACFSAPAIMMVQPTASSTAMYSEVYTASVQEGRAGDFDAVEGWMEIEAELTITRAPFFGISTSVPMGETLINATSMQNRGTGGTPNMAAFSAGSGDMIYEGGPLNYAITGISNLWTFGYLASVLSRGYQAVGSNTVSTSSTAGTLFAASHSFTFSIAQVLTRGRLIGRLTPMSGPIQVRAEIYVTGAVVPDITTPWVTPRGTTSGAVADFGALRWNALRARQLSNVTATVLYYARSTTGGAVSATLASAELIQYYDFCAIDFGTAGSTAAVSIGIYTFTDQAGRAALPFAVPAVYGSGTGVLANPTVRGTIPRYFSGASLWIAWLNSSNVYNATDSVFMTTRHAPLWRSLRGST